MGIKSFTEFNESNIQESRHSSEYYEAHGKTSFSRWLRGIGEKIGIGDGGYTSYYSDGPDNMSTLKSAAMAIPLTIKSLAKGTAAIIDFLAPGEDTKSWKDLDKEELKRKKAEIIKRWETEQIENKHVTDKDAEQFYKSGVLRGKKYFGEDFTPLEPKDKEQEIYRDYLKDIMGTYYRKTNKKR